LGNEIQVIEEGIKGIIASILKEGVEKGVFREMDISATAQCILVLFRGFTYRRVFTENENREWVSFTLNAIVAR